MSILKQKNVLLSLVVGMMLSACQPQKNEPEAPVESSQQQIEHIQTLKGRSEALSFNLPECSGKYCLDFKVERLVSNFPFIDQIIDQEILKQLQQSVDIIPVTEASNPVTNETITPTEGSELQQKIQPYLKNLLNLEEELRALNANNQISLSISPKILNDASPLATVVLNTHSYLGGAHGATVQQYFNFNFDLAQKKQIVLDDVLLSGKKQLLKDKVHEKFKAWVLEQKLADNVSEYEQAWPFMLTQNFYLDQDGLTLQYAEYEIGPYVVGLPQLKLSYAELEGILKPQYLPSSQQSSSASEVSP